MIGERRLILTARQSRRLIVRSRSLTIDPHEPGEVKADPGGDLLAAAPVLNPCLHNLAYRYPVHRISEDFRPEAPGDGWKTFRQPCGRLPVVLASLRPPRTCD